MFLSFYWKAGTLVFNKITSIYKVCLWEGRDFAKVSNSAAEEFPLQGNFGGPIIEVPFSSSVTNSDYPWGKK